LLAAGREWFILLLARARVDHEKMMRAKARGTFPDAMKEPAPPPSAAAAKVDEWEVRPGGMLVQKRSPDAAAPVPNIRVKVKFNGVYHEIYISAQASFGELKKMLSAKTGLHPEDQKIVYKDKDRNSKAFLDMAGVKDRSKMVMLEDPAAKAKRLLEERRTSKAQRASKAVSRITLDVDKLATKVSALETVVAKGGKVVDADVVTLTEALMNELVKLDSIAAEGDVKVQRRMQEKRVQKHVGTLDAIRAKHAPAANANKAQAPRPPPVSQRRNFQQQQQPATAAPPTARWETFDLLSSAPSTSSSTTVTTMAAATTTSPAAATNPIPRFNWELF
jgi:hypothetical protein